MDNKMIAGEVSNMRVPNVGLGSFYTGTAPTYRLDSSKVSTRLARALYDNTDERYKLGAGFAAPVVNAKVGFMGMPTFISDDEGAMEALREFVEENKGRIHDTLVGSLRDGDAYVWLTTQDIGDSELYPEQNVKINYNIVPPERVETLIDPTTGEVQVYKITTPMEWVDKEDEAKQCTVTQFVTRGQIDTVIEGDKPPHIDEGIEKLPYNFIPIVHFKNRGYNMQYGQSELEPIEPFMKAYHDVMLHAMQGSKMHSTPKLKIKTEDVKGFLANNLSDEQLDALSRGEQVEISLENKELIILTQDDEAGFIEATSAIGDARDILKYLFFNIVDASETPEFVFGVHTPSSQASVKEQMPVLIRGVEAKRDHFSDSFDLLARIVLRFVSINENVAFSTYATKITWDDIDPRSANEKAEELQSIVTALATAKQNGLISDQSAVDYLSTKINTMQTYEGDGGKGEGELIKETLMRSYRMPDVSDLKEELKEIEKELE